jgi:hypothetical protein
MIARRFAVAVGLTAAMLLAGVVSTAVAQASVKPAGPDIYGYYADFWGTGSTLALAKQNADLMADQAGCGIGGPLVSSSESGGVWRAEIQAICPWDPA